MRTNSLKFALLGWCLFDFANSIVAVIGGIYFAKWFTEDIGASPIILNLLFFSSALFILLTGKWIGRKIDINGYVFWIKLSSILAFFAVLFIFISSQILPNYYIIPLSFILFLIFLFGYQVGRICHNVYLRSVIPDEIQSKMSGYGAAANWAGSVFGIVITIPIITMYPNMFGRELTFLLASISFGILVYIALLLMFSYKLSNSKPIQLSNESKYKWNHFFPILSVIMIYFLLFDVMATVEKNLPPYLSVVSKMNDDKQAFGFLLILISAMIGGIIAAKKINFNNSYLWLKIGAISLSLSILLITISNSISLWISFVSAGITYGVLESAIRLNFMKRFPSEHAGENFGVLAAVERTSGVIGPLLWIIPFGILSNQHQSYIVSMQLMSFLAILAFGLLFLKDKSQNDGTIK